MKKNDSKQRKAVNLLINADRMHRSAIEAKTEKLGIHRSQHLALLTVALEEGKQNQITIAEQLQISPAAVSVTMKKLEKGGFIDRCDTETDARQKRLTLTEKGKKTVAETRVLFDQVDDMMCEGISGEELDTFCAVLSKMIENLKNNESGKG